MAFWANTNPCKHEFEGKAIGGFPGHEHIHPSGDAYCKKCGKSLGEWLVEEINDYKRNNILYPSG